MNTRLSFLIICAIGFIPNCSRNNPVGPGEGNLGVRMVSIPQGTFLMGSEVENERLNPVFREYMRPAHMVYLDAFEMSETEITQLQYKALMKTNPSQTVGDSLPVGGVSWYDAARFCNRLSDFYQLERSYDENSWECDFKKNGFRLPTEAEWEYACRAGTTTLFYSGDTEDDLASVGWYRQNSGSQTLFPVGRKEANAWGLHDMHGNVSEWCNDWFYAYSNWHVINPRGSVNGIEKVERGGSTWSPECFVCWSAYRVPTVPDGHRPSLGFRVVRNTLPECISTGSSRRD
jgi:formylglycine-generating enzyme required for sulfatase activity